MTQPAANLFVYGTLLFDDVVKRVTGRTFQSIHASLQGFSRHAIERHGKRESYPAIKPDPGGTVVGKVLLNIDERSLSLIDAYELDPPEYELRKVEVETTEGQWMEASTYVAAPALIPLLKGPWDPKPDLQG